MFNEKTCINLLKSLHNSNQNFLLQVTPFSTKITVKNSFVNSYHQPGPKKNHEVEDVKKSGSLARLGHENKLLKSELIVEEAVFDQEALVDGLQKSENDVLELEKSLEISKNKLKQTLRDFSEKLNANRLFYEANMKELKEFKASKIAEEKKKKKIEKKARKKDRKNEIRALCKAMDRLAPKSSDSEPGIKELFSSEVLEEVNEDKGLVDKNRNFISSKVENISEETNCTICAVIIPDYAPTYFHGIEINPACQDCSPTDPILKNQLSLSYGTDTSSTSSTQASAEATFTKGSEVSRIETIEVFPPQLHLPPFQVIPPSNHFPPIKPFPPFVNY